MSLADKALRQEERDRDYKSQSTNKYDKTSEFLDPVVRCDSCQKIIKRETIHKCGLCPGCGNKRVRNVLAFNDEELKQTIEWNIDPEFTDLFERVSDE